jgi:hypothetical protein
MPWVRYSDVFFGDTVASLDGERIELFTAASFELSPLHLAMANLTATGPDRHGRFVATISAQASGRGPMITLTVEEPEWPRVTVWLHAVEAAQRALPPPVA